MATKIAPSEIHMAAVEAVRMAIDALGEPKTLMDKIKFDTCINNRIVEIDDRINDADSRLVCSMISEAKNRLLMPSDWRPTIG